MIKRSIYPSLKNHLNKDEITLITGPRQSGKTTLMEYLMKDLKEMNKDYVYLNLDVESDFSVLKSQQSLINFLELELGKNPSVVFLDEIQRKENAGIFLKGLYDMGLPYKFVVSGSGSVELKEKVSESLAGRKKVFKLRTLSFGEFINYKTDYKYEDKPDKFFDSPTFSEEMLDEYLWMGGYPEVVKNRTLREKREVLEEINNSFIDRDLKDLLNIRNTGAVNDLLAFLSNRAGKLTPISGVSNRVNIGYETARRYLYYLEKTFQVTSVSPFFKNPETELTKAQTYYFEDLGMRNFVFNNLSHFNPLVSGPMLFQNFVFLLLSDQEMVTKINYWRSKSGAEVDFVAKSGSIIIPVEVKYKDLSKPKVTKSMHSFISTYKPNKFLVVNRSFRHKTEVNETEVVFLPYYDLVYKNILDI